jgi:hypothetical protein
MSLLAITPGNTVHIVNDNVWHLGYQYREPSEEESKIYNQWMTDTFPNKENYKKFLDAMVASILQKESEVYTLYGTGSNSKTMMGKLIHATFDELISLRSSPNDFELASNRFIETNILNGDEKNVINFEACWTIDGPLKQDWNFEKKIPYLKFAFLKTIINYINGTLVL